MCCEQNIKAVTAQPRLRVEFLPPRRSDNAVLAMARCLCVYASVRHKPIFYRNGQTGQSGFGTDAFFNPSYTVFSEKLTIAKIWTLPSETLLQTQDLEKFRPSQVLST